ncbi:MAG TPA: flagellar FliJ family protein [Actinomycetales bacterium]|nr:flagellar FliJ family protein [Actinomycetales bacterium]
MSGFKLAGLLRLRNRHEEAARRSLGEAQLAALQAQAAVRASAEHAHEVADLDSATAQAFLAAQCARAAAFAQLADSHEVERQSAVRLDEARDSWQAARSRARAVEKLAEQHAAREVKEQARLEQVESDDRSGARVGRRTSAADVEAGDPA